MGFNFGKFLAIAQIVAPAALAATGVPAVLIPLVLHGIQLAESHPEKLDGPAKKQFALDAVSTGVAAVNAVKPGAVSDSWPTVVGAGIDATVGAIKAVQNAQPVEVQPATS